MKFNDLNIGNFFTTYEQGKMLVGVKINTENAINMATGDKITLHFNRRVDAGKVTSLDLEKTTLARRQDEIILASPTDNGRWLVHSFLITSTELCNAENLSFPTNTGECGENDSLYDDEENVPDDWEIKELDDIRADIKRRANDAGIKYVELSE